MNTLKAEKRTLAVKAKKLRREGYVTGNVFGKEMKESIPVKMDAAAVDRLLKTSNKGSQIMLDLDGEQMDVLVKEVDYDSMGSKVLEIDFQALVSGEMVHSVAEVVLLNHEKVLDGILQQKLEELEQMVIDARFECTGPQGLTTTEYEHQLTKMLKLIRSIDEVNES